MTSCRRWWKRPPARPGRRWWGRRRARPCLCAPHVFPPAPAALRPGMSRGYVVRPVEEDRQASMLFTLSMAAALSHLASSSVIRTDFAVKVVSGIESLCDRGGVNRALHPARGRLARSASCDASRHQPVRVTSGRSSSGFRWLTRGAVSFDARRAIPTIDERAGRVPHFCSAGLSRASGSSPARAVWSPAMASTDRVRERRRAAALARHYRDEEGLSIVEIARRLGRAPATIKAYLYDPSDANKGPYTSLGATRAVYGAPRRRKPTRATGPSARRHGVAAPARRPIPSGARAHAKVCGWRGSAPSARLA